MWGKKLKTTDLGMVYTIFYGDLGDGVVLFYPH